MVNIEANGQNVENRCEGCTHHNWTVEITLFNVRNRGHSERGRERQYESEAGDNWSKKVSCGNDRTNVLKNSHQG